MLEARYFQARIKLAKKVGRVRPGEPRASQARWKFEVRGLSRLAGTDLPYLLGELDARLRNFGQRYRH
jgi:hypothetical protein